MNDSYSRAQSFVNPLGAFEGTGARLLNSPVLVRQEFTTMNMQNENSFEQFLSQKDEEAWSAALATLLRSIHEVDRNATQIWFAFYPLSLWQALAHAEDLASAGARSSHGCRAEEVADQAHETLVDAIVARFPGLDTLDLHLGQVHTQKTHKSCVAGGSRLDLRSLR